MNSTLPPARDLPPGRQAEIRAELERAVAARHTFRFAPLVTAVAAVAAVVGAVAFLAPWQREDTAAPARQGTTEVPTASASPTPAKPVIPGLSPERIAEIEDGCPTSAGTAKPSTLHQYLEDEAGKFAFLLGPGGTALGCTVDGPGMPFNSDLSAGFDLEWMPGHISADSNGGATGGDVPGNKAVYRNQHGTSYVAGRVSSEVARVTFTDNGRTLEATIANGTFLARVVHPTTWTIPENYSLGDIRAYDAAGNLLGTAADTAGNCYVTPDNRVVYGQWRDPDVDPSTCKPATRWR